MRFSDIARHLAPYSIVAKRKTTISNAFASAIAPCDVFDEQRVRKAISLLGQDPNTDLYCVYCGSAAETWDHVFGLVRDGIFSGHGHRLGNLLPCCKLCNSKKGNRNWKQYLESLSSSEEDKARRISTIEQYLNEYFVIDEISRNSPEHQELQSIKKEILTLMSKADVVAKRIRESWN